MASVTHARKPSDETVSAFLAAVCALGSETPSRGETWKPLAVAVPGLRLTDRRSGVTLVAVPEADAQSWLVRAWAVAALPSDRELLPLLWSYLEQEAPPTVSKVIGFAPSREGEDGNGLVTDFVGSMRECSREARRLCDEEELHRHAEGVELGTYGGAVPFQAEGTWNGYPFYFRYRNGSASLDIALPGDSPVLLAAWRATCMYGGPFDGFLEFREFCLLFCLLAQGLRKAPFPFQFKLLSAPPDCHSMRTSGAVTLLGETAREALLRAQNSGYWAGCVFADVPENEDPRKFPSTRPVFPVRRGSVLEAQRLIEASGGWWPPADVIPRD